MAEDKTNNDIEDIAEDDEPLYYTLEYDDGTIIEAEVLGEFDVDNKTYIALIPDDESDDVYIYGYDENAEEMLIDIEDDAEFERAVKEFDRIMAEAGQ